MSASSDYEATRRARRKKPVKARRKKYVAFMRCGKCNYDWGQQLYADQKPEQWCPRCGGKAERY